MSIIVQSLLGGLMIGASAAGLLLVNGRVAGVSGILGGAARLAPGAWRWAFLAGLLAAGAAAARFGGGAPAGLQDQGIWVLAAAGLAVGAGTRMGSGCTSGHGVCGLANLSLRSLAATVMFMAVAGGVVFATHHLDPAHRFVAQEAQS